MNLKQGIIALIFSLMVVWSNGQTSNIVRTYRQTDTCLFLQVLPYNVYSFTDSIQKLYLLDKFKCIKSETLTLKPASPDNNEIFTWLSFPRLNRQNGNPTVNAVLGGDNIEPNSPPDIYYKAGSQLENLPLNSETNNSYITSVFQNNVWSSANGLNTCDSKLGYKLTLKYNSFPNQQVKLHLHGTVLQPDIAINTIYGNNKENWIGYWLYQEQSPFDAISTNDLDKLTEIKTQDWYCYKDWSMGMQTPQWICGVGIGVNSPVLKYGSMAILKSNSDITGFRWQSGYLKPLSDLKSATEHFQYEEKADYTAYLIEVDTTNRPDEIVAYIGNTCFGASKVLENDTMVLVRGYDKDTTGTVYFVQFFGSHKSTPPAIKSYFVKNRFNTGWQQRSISAQERHSHYLISFNAKKEIKPDNVQKNDLFSLYPNPAQNSVAIEYNLKDKGNVTLTLYDVAGRVVLHQTVQQQAGIHRQQLNTKKLQNGLYLLRLSTSKETGTKRLIIRK